MEIVDLKIDDMKRPLGFAFSSPEFSWTVLSSGKRQTAYRVTIKRDEPEGGETVYDSGKVYKRETRHAASFTAESRTRYFWRVCAADDCGEEGTSDWEVFETGAGSLSAEVIACGERAAHPLFFRTFEVKRPVERARLYIFGAGMFVPFLNGKRLTDERLMPGCTDYTCIKQIYTFAVRLSEGRSELSVLLGNGWYKGRFAARKNIYGDEYSLACELDIVYRDGGRERICSDESWRFRDSVLCDDGIYDGERLDMTVVGDVSYPVERRGKADAAYSDRMSVPVIAEEYGRPKRAESADGEFILDVGQNMAGFLSARGRLPAGETLLIEYGEILENGRFFRGNLRTAKQCFSVVGNGEYGEFAPEFTYFGYRYARVSGTDPKNLEFTAYALSSQIERTGRFDCPDALIKRLYENTVWGEKSNFVDIPTDCPQRDERFGWTGDAQIFSETALLHGDCSAFYRKYLRDVRNEAERWGAPTDFAPAFLPDRKEFSLYGSSGWADAIAVIPEQIYDATGSLRAVRENYPCLCRWIEYMRKREKDGLYSEGGRYGEWLALDGEDGLRGSTDAALVSNVYYYRSVRIAQKFAGLLGLTADGKKYAALAESVRARWRERFVKDGALRDETQTGHALSISFGLLDGEEKTRAARELAEMLKNSGYAMKTGFLGTPVLLSALSENGFEEAAVAVLLRREAPGWLYPVTVGATTMWERIYGLQNIDKYEMNSFNHYQGGSVAAWLYRGLCGFSKGRDPYELCFRPVLSERLPEFSGSIVTAAGRYEMTARSERDYFRVTLVVPFNGTAVYRGRRLEAGEYTFEEPRKASGGKL